MIHYSKETRLKPEEVLDKARSFFGETGLGLELKNNSPHCLFFEGGGGFVHVTACEGEKKTEMDLETREWESPAKEFLRTIKK